MPGDKVHVEFDAVVVEPDSSDHVRFGNPIYPWLKVYNSKTGTYHYLWNNNEDLKVVELTDWEKYGPPQAGDIWEVNGAEFNARKQTSGRVVLDSADCELAARFFGYSDGGPWSMANFAALNPKLVRRRGLATGGVLDNGYTVQVH